MLDECLGFWAFTVFTFNQTLKHLKKTISKPFSVGTRRETSFLTSTTAVDLQQ